MTDSPPISRVATTGAVIAAIAVSLPAIGILGIHAGALTPMQGFTCFTAGAVLGGLGSLLLGAIGAFLTRGGRDPEGRMRAWIALGGGAALLGSLAIAGSPGAGLPPINDITTDLADPPRFEGDPSGRGRDMAYPEDWKPLVREAYPDLVSIELDASVPEAMQRVARAAEELGWTVTRNDPEAGTLEARDATAIFQFVDDVAVRVRPRANGSTVDVRSKSRDGRGDVGANAARIRALRSAL